MDEMIRAKGLVEEILRKAASIRSHMSSVSQSMDNIKQMEMRAGSGPPAAPARPLLDLPQDVLSCIVTSIDNHQSMCSFGQACKRLRAMVVQDEQWWGRRCREDWGVAEPDASSVPQMHTLLRGMTAAHEAEILLAELTGTTVALARTRCGGSCSAASSSSSSAVGAAGSLTRSLSSSLASPPPSPSAAAPAPASSALRRSHTTAVGGGGSGQGRHHAAQLPRSCLWLQVYRDRAHGWRLVESMLQWLQAHGHPASVTGVKHRLQLHLALKYVAVFTAQFSTAQHQAAPSSRDQQRRRRMLELGALHSLLGLLANDASAVQEGALAALGNIVRGDAESKLAVVLASRSGRLLGERLEAGRLDPGMVQQASRLLTNLWASAPCPEVQPLTAQCTPARPPLRPGAWLLHEFSTRGECMAVVPMLLSFDAATGAICGGGSLPADGGSGGGQQAAPPSTAQAAEPFTIKGCVNLQAGSWNMTRQDGHGGGTIEYQGFCDLYGAFGVYEPQRFAGPFGGGAARGCPRVFRLYHSAELLDDERSGDGGSKQSEDGTGDEAQQPQSEQQQLLVQHAAGLSLAEVLAPQAPLFID